MVKISRLEIPKSEEDLRKISEEIMREEAEKHEHEQEEVVEAHEAHGYGHEHEVDLGVIAHQLGHLQELMLQVIQGVREVRDSIDDLSATLRRSLRALALLQAMSVIDDAELKKKLLEQVAKDLGIDITKK
jgi:hypothetical protein